MHIIRLLKSLSPLVFCGGSRELIAVVRELVCNCDVFWNIVYRIKMMCLKIRRLYFLNVHNLNFKSVFYSRESFQEEDKNVKSQ